MEENNMINFIKQIKNHKQTLMEVKKYAAKIYSNSQLKLEKSSIVKYNKLDKRKKIINKKINLLKQKLISLIT